MWILRKYYQFDEFLGIFHRHAFDNHWIMLRTSCILLRGIGTLAKDFHRKEILLRIEGLANGISASLYVGYQCGSLFPHFRDSGSFIRCYILQIKSQVSTYRMLEYLCLISTQENAVMAKKNGVANMFSTLSVEIL